MQFFVYGLSLQEHSTILEDCSCVFMFFMAFDMELNKNVYVFSVCGERVY